MARELEKHCKAARYNLLLCELRESAKRLVMYNNNLLARINMYQDLSDLYRGELEKTIKELNEKRYECEKLKEKIKKLENARPQNT
jgi:uncharacterized coiled-coil DUF342 family protein